jgi:hypothetical protein
MPGIYEIARNGRPVANGLFNTIDEIRELVEIQPAGAYDLHRIFPSDANGVVNTEYVGELTRHDDGQVSYCLIENIVNPR